jgi:hypothetical protein
MHGCHSELAGSQPTAPAMKLQEFHPFQTVGIEPAVIHLDGTLLKYRASGGG